VQSCCGGDKLQGEEGLAHFFSALHWLSPINANSYSLEQPGAAKLVQSKMVRGAIGILLFMNHIHELFLRTNSNTTIINGVVVTPLAYQETRGSSPFSGSRAFISTPKALYSEKVIATRQLPSRTTEIPLQGIPKTVKGWLGYVNSSARTG
jgi:hypothetical protein